MHWCEEGSSLLIAPHRSDVFSHCFICSLTLFPFAFCFYFHFCQLYKLFLWYSGVSALLYPNKLVEQMDGKKHLMRWFLHGQWHLLSSGTKQQRVLLTMLWEWVMRRGRVFRERSNLLKINSSEEEIILSFTVIRSHKKLQHLSSATRLKYVETLCFFLYS